MSSLFGGVIFLCASKRLLITMNQHMFFEITRLFLQQRKCILPIRYQLKFDSGRERFYTIVKKNSNYSTQQHLKSFSCEKICLMWPEEMIEWKKLTTLFLSKLKFKHSLHSGVGKLGAWADYFVQAAGRLPPPGQKLACQLLLLCYFSINRKSLQYGRAHLHF